jgi:hypothetical protein
VTDDAGRVTTTVTQCDRRHWGEGGEEFHWWCTEAPEAFGGRRPVYETMSAELKAIAGKDVYERLAAYLDVRKKGGRPLPHPTVRAR